MLLYLYLPLLFPSNLPEAIHPYIFIELKHENGTKPFFYFCRVNFPKCQLPHISEPGERIPEHTYKEMTETLSYIAQLTISQHPIQRVGEGKWRLRETTSNRRENRD